MKGIIVFLVCISALAVLMNGAANWLESQPISKNERFEVVDTYKGCDVVRYTPQNDAKYHYFLDCKK